MLLQQALRVLKWLMQIKVKDLSIDQLFSSISWEKKTVPGPVVSWYNCRLDKIDFGAS